LSQIWTSTSVANVRRRVIGELFASVPGQQSVESTGQSLRLFDQRRDDTFSILVRDLDQHHVAQMTLDKRCDIAVPGPAD
jgi:hypothetical protein